MLVLLFRFAKGFEDAPPDEKVKPVEGAVAPKLKVVLPPKAGNDAFAALLSWPPDPFTGGKLCEGVVAPNNPPP